MIAANNHLLCSRVCKYVSFSAVQFTQPGGEYYRVSKGWSVKRK
jgi:hypothetical protein